MTLPRLVLPIILGLLFTASAEAQWVRTAHPVQRLDRWLGLGNGHGYHWKNPGPDPSWYNPWSALNSTRYSENVGPEPDLWLNNGAAPGWSATPFGTSWETPSATNESREPTPAAPRESGEGEEPVPAEQRPNPSGEDADQVEAARLLDRQYQSSGWAGG